jgi:hypothetical protein
MTQNLLGKRYKANLEVVEKGELTGFQFGMQVKGTTKAILAPSFEITFCICIGPYFISPHGRTRMYPPFLMIGDGCAISAA